MRRTRSAPPTSFGTTWTSSRVKGTTPTQEEAVDLTVDQPADNESCVPLNAHQPFCKTQIRLGRFMHREPPVLAFTQLDDNSSHDRDAHVAA
jgi:hypothetical protein